LTLGNKNKNTLQNHTLLPKHALTYTVVHIFWTIQTSVKAKTILPQRKLCE